MKEQCITLNISSLRKNKDRGQFMFIQGGVEELKSVVVTSEVKPMSDIWFYQDGLIKNKLSPNMCLQVMGSIEPENKVLLWTETQQPADLGSPDERPH